MFYYLAGVSVVGTIGFGLFYLYDERAATEVLENISWSTVRAYHRVNMETNNLRRYLEIELVESKNSEVEEDDEREEEENLVDYITDKTGWCISSIRYCPNRPHPLTAYK